MYVYVHNITTAVLNAVNFTTSVEPNLRPINGRGPLEQRGRAPNTRRLSLLLRGMLIRSGESYQMISNIAWVRNVSTTYHYYISLSHSTIDATTDATTHIPCLGNDPGRHIVAAVWNADGTKHQMSASRSYIHGGGKQHAKKKNSWS